MTEFNFSLSQEIWQEQAAYDAELNHELHHQNRRGPCNIFILDTSSSLGLEGFEQMKAVFTTIIDEYAKYHDMDENVAVIVCGRNTRFLRYFSHRYEDIRHCLDDVEFGGPSPLTAALFLAHGSFARGGCHSVLMGDVCINPRLIFVSDGRPTDFTTTASCDDCPEIETENDKRHLLDLARVIGKVNPIFCIPVGRNVDMTILESICTQSRGGKIVDPEHAKQFARYTENTKIAAGLSFALTNDGNDRERFQTHFATSFKDRFLTDKDQDDIFEICTKKQHYRPIEDLQRESNDIDEVRRDPKMLPVGSRVRRGKDWQWGEQDNFGPGTVIRHAENGWLVVQWDFGSDHCYRYGTARDFKDKYDVEMCFDPRTLDNDLIAVGCLVKRGPDWTWADQDGGAGNIGSVFFVQKNGVVHVRWENGTEKIYRFGQHGKFDVEVCDPFSPEVTRYLKDQIATSELNHPGANGYYWKEDVSHDHSHYKKELGKESSSFKQVTNPILHVTKGKYFKNRDTDIETDGQAISRRMNQWFWKDETGTWNPYTREINDRINKSFKRDPKSTVIVTVKEQSIVMAKNIKINLTTREISEVKLVDENSTNF